MANPGLSELLKWSVENSAVSKPEDAESQPPKEARGLSQQALAALLGGPSEADLMRESMAAINSKEIDLENRIVAFDNFEQLIENLDNANNMGPMGLWTPLVAQLESEEPDMRRMAAWCIGTAVQNNTKSQERLLISGGLPILVNLAVNDTNELVRKKAILALSSGIRNYQPSLDVVLEALPAEHKIEQALDAMDMDSVNILTDKLREHSKQKA